MPHLVIILLLTAITVAVGEHPGETIYQTQCAECHGPRGEGVEDEYDEPLYGDRTVADLAKLIHKTMPDYAPEECEDEQAEQVAQYIHDAFYSMEAQARNQPARVGLVRLTATQHQQSVADLIGGFRRPSEPGDEHGLRGQYYDDRNRRREKRRIDRVDSQVQFQFGTESPDMETISSEAFAIEWEGALLVEETGLYEFSVRTENGFKLYVNADSEVPLIDGWVSTGMLSDQRVAVRLLGGRAYPLRLEYFNFKGKSASVELRWKPPHGVDEVIPSSHLLTGRASPVMVLQAPFPADDRSLGYVRGSAVSKAWHEATTAAAIETADHVVRNLHELAGIKRKDDDRLPEAREFAERFVERAFRRPLTEAERALFVEAHFSGDVPVETAVKRVVILGLKSPRFLFPEAHGDTDRAWTLASRLSQFLHDGLPDEPLRRAVKEGRLTQPADVRREARRLLALGSTRAKVRGFLYHWLHLDEEHDLSKDEASFPEFDRRTIADLRRSLNLFLDAVVWSASSDYRELLLDNDLYLNAKLAKLLGHGTFEGDQFRKVAFDPSVRAGVLTHPYLLARFAYHMTTSPIHRGVFVTRKVLGRSLKPPPEAVQFDESRFDPHLTMREKVTELTKSRACMNCHSIINPLGFSFEHFDAVGRYRFKDESRAIDATSDFETHAGELITLSGARDVAQHAASSPQAHEGFIQHLFEHLVKQPVNAYGTGQLERLRQKFAKSHYNMQDLMVEIVTLAALHQLEIKPTKDDDNDA